MPSHDRMLEWVGGAYDPTAFDLEGQAWRPTPDEPFRVPVRAKPPRPRPPCPGEEPEAWITPPLRADPSAAAPRF